MLLLISLNYEEIIPTPTIMHNALSRRAKTIAKVFGKHYAFVCYYFWKNTTFNHLIQDS